MSAEGSRQWSRAWVSPAGTSVKLKLYLASLFLFISLIATGLWPTMVQAGSDDYPAAWQGPMDSMLDNWGYYNRECTSFVAWRLHGHNGFEMPRAIGNASGWGTWANNHGYTVDMNPAIGSVAWFSNHVAWVEAINGGTVTLEEYNNVDSNHDGIYGNDGTYSQRTIMASSANGYIHFKDLSGPVPGGGGMAGLTFMGSNHLDVSQILKPNQYILSDDVRFFLVMQGDGNLVLYGPGYRAYWASGTAGSGAVYAAMQGDGNLVLYRANWTPVWSSQTNGRGNSYLYVQNDGNLVVYTTGWQATWDSHTGGHSAWEFYSAPLLNTNQALGLNQYIRSINKKYAVALQDDGNLVLYGPAYHVLWHSVTGSRGVVNAIMQGDGNLVLYRWDGRAMWDSHTWGRGSSFLIMQDDGNLVIYTTQGQPTWDSHTGGQI